MALSEDVDRSIIKLLFLAQGGPELEEVRALVVEDLAVSAPLRCQRARLSH